MKLHNTLTKQAEEVIPLDENNVRIYTCGPTVYDHIHIGNLASFIFADTLRRVIKASGIQTTHVMNFTDVDDKTIKRSREQYPDLEPLEALLKLTGENSQIFLSDMQEVGNSTQDLRFVKATDSIDDMQALVTNLQSKGFAYIAEDGVYFSIEAYKQSGKKYGQLSSITASSTSEQRIQNDEYDKESAHDFALWKKQKPGEPAWDFQIDGHNIVGRPGWHLECSAMSRAALRQPFDIHTGGVDLIFPHHENEIAQSTATAEDSIYARLFAHNEHLLVDGQKMSKSLNNFYTLEAVKTKGYSPLAFRLLVLQAHYRKQAHFSWKNLEAAQNRLKIYQAMADLRWQPKDKRTLDSESFTRTLDEIKQYLFDDLNTPLALSLLSAQSDVLANELVNTANLEDHAWFIRQIDELLGLKLGESKDISGEQKQLISEREEAREASDWAKSDVLRGQLEKQGIGLRDTAHGAIWFRL